LVLLAVVSVAAQNDWDYFVFRQQWPGGIPRPKVAWPACTKNWTIHGLWATKNGTDNPSNCPGPAYSPSAIADLVSTMDCVWPSDAESNANFWGHEWSKHGTCALNDPNTNSQHAFFGAAIRLNQKFSFASVLVAAGITPSYDTPYKIGDIRSALAAAIGVKPGLECQSHRLMAASVCISKTLLPVDCTDTENSCGADTKTIWYNPIKNHTSSE